QDFSSRSLGSSLDRASDAVMMASFTAAPLSWPASVMLRSRSGASAIGNLPSVVLIHPGRENKKPLNPVVCTSNTTLGAAYPRRALIPLNYAHRHEQSTFRRAI